MINVSLQSLSKRNTQTGKRNATTEPYWYLEQ